ncbi:hypothetical protein N7510_009472 [Penicillium lagena]|uniref:uncharacterized protein n=1 Tax=Penicillium lagena TaxID=94218 RepID=UPI0025410C98|nr:uncharacterized protein N7510_009472 [Penicillium lagena]KAJ5606691.1 hypothetical protein N7510_009472 [Penicillium lagena]
MPTREIRQPPRCGPGYKVSATTVSAKLCTLPPESGKRFGSGSAAVKGAVLTTINPIKPSNFHQASLTP